MFWSDPERNQLEKTVCQAALDDAQVPAVEERLRSTQGLRVNNLGRVESEREAQPKV